MQNRELDQKMITTTTWDDAENVLCVRLDTIGDVLMTTPAIRALKESYRGKGQRRITLLTSAPGSAIVPFIPEIDDLIVYDAPWLKATAPRHDSSPEFKMIEKLKEQNFDAAVIFTVFSQNPLPSAFMCYLADIPLRLAHCHENPYQLLTDWVRDFEPVNGIRHEVRRQLDLVNQVGCSTANERLSVRPTAKDNEKIKNLLSKFELDLSRPWVLIHPGATASSRRYPPESFAKAASELVSDEGWQVIFTGSGDEEVALVERIRHEMEVGSFSLAGQLTLGEMIALLSVAPMLISNNTGPVHIAAALDTPVVDLYALTNPQHTPWLVSQRVLSFDVPCKNCFKSVCPEGHHNCLSLIKPESVVQAAVELLAENKKLQSAYLG